MASITIRRLEDSVKERLRARAARHGVSMEEEAREILKIGVAQTEETCANWVKELRRRVAAVGGVDLPIPPRGPMREPPDFGK
jgi:plasmid stability protein